MTTIKNPVAIISGGGGGDIVNGIIEQYKAVSSDISANTFVEFVNKTLGTDAALSNTTFGGGATSATLVSPDTVFIAHSGDGVNSATAHLYGVVCTVSGTTITAGADTQISSSYSGVAFSVTSLSSSSVFIAHNSSATNTNSRLYGIVCSISGTTITAGTDTLLTSYSYGGVSISAVAVSSDKVFIAHSAGNAPANTASRLYGIACSISGTTITAGTEAQLSTASASGYAPSAILIASNTVFVAHNGEGAPADTLSRLWGAICTISETTVALAADQRLSSTTYGGASASATLVSPNKVLVAHNGDGQMSYAASRLYGIVCSISGAVITAGADTRLVDSFAVGVPVSAVSVANDTAFVAYSGISYGNQSESRLYGVPCTISGTDITPNAGVILSDVTYGGMSISVVGVSPDMLFIAHNGGALYSNTNGRLYGTTVEPTLRVAQSSAKIDGLTKNDVTSTTAGNIWVLNN